MSRLIESLAVSGSRKSDGTANASGLVFLYSPGTTSRVLGYRDDQLSEAWTTVAGGIPLDAAGKVKIWINDPVDVVIQDASGTTVDTMLGFAKTRAEQIEVENESYTGAVTDSSGAVTQDLGGRIDLDTLLTRAGESLGPDFEYKESSGATARPYIEVIRGIQISVKDFGAAGNNIKDDTAAVQAAVLEAKRLGAGVVFFDAGTYKISGTAIALSSTTGIELRGAGKGASILSQTTAATNALTITTSTDFTIRNMSITGSVVLTDAVRPVFENVVVGGVYGLNIGGTLSSDVRIDNCYLTGTTNALLLTNTVRVSSFATQFNNLAGTAIEFAAATGAVGIYAGIFAATTGVFFNSNLSSTQFIIAGCPTLGSNTTTPLSIGTATIPSGFRQWGNGVDTSSTSGNTGATQTPVLYNGNEVLLNATGGGAGTVTVAAPAILPATTTKDVNLYWDFILKGAAGGNATFDFNAVYKITGGGTTIVVTDGHQTAVRFRWDRVTSKLRQVSSGDTVT